MQIVGDVSQPEDAERVVQTTLGQFGALHIDRLAKSTAPLAWPQLGKQALLSAGGAPASSPG